MQDVYGAEQDLDRPVQRQVQFIVVYQDIVLAVGILRIDAERVGKR